MEFMKFKNDYNVNILIPIIVLLLRRSKKSIKLQIITDLAVLRIVH